MEKLTTVNGLPAPGEHESWAELAEHSVEHDHAEPDRWRVTHPPDPAAPRGL